MAVIDQKITDQYAVYNGDSIEVLPAIKNNSVHLSVYSPPFCGLYNYSSSDRDMSNCKDYDQFFEHYEFLVREIHRVMMPGRLSAVHCMDVGAGDDDLVDFPGDIIRLHRRLGFHFHARFGIWKEPLRVAIRTRSKGLTHRQIVKDSTLTNNAGADFLLIFRKEGTNPVPVTHPLGLLKYVGEREVPQGFELPNGDVIPASRYMNDWKDPKTNKLAHWIWQQYASSYWDDVRIGRVLPYKPARDPEDEKHVHPLQLDVIERAVMLYSNPEEIVLTPCMGVGSEVAGALMNGRRGIGVELKQSYFRQAVKNLDAIIAEGGVDKSANLNLFDEEELEDMPE